MRTQTRWSIGCVAMVLLIASPFGCAWYTEYQARETLTKLYDGLREGQIPSDIVLNATSRSKLLQAEEEFGRVRTYRIEKLLKKLDGLLQATIYAEREKRSGLEGINGISRKVSYVWIIPDKP